MVTALVVIAILLIIVSVLPFVQHQHWVFRVAEFIKIQLLFLQLFVFGLTLIYVQGHPWLWGVQAVQFALIVYHIYILMRYTKFWRQQHVKKTSASSGSVKIVSCNIYQYNTEYQRFISLIRREHPDIFVTMESNADWEQAMRCLEKDYPFQEKVTLENTYGMHFYTKLKVHRLQTHYFVADDIPSIEAELETRDGQRFAFFAVHPPPPSPTEEENSKERDGDLLSVAKKVRKLRLPVLVTGDFNNVAWAKSSILFKKTSELIDARIGRGILSTFHAKYWFFRVPLDLLFHSTTIFIDKLFIYPSVGSDHFPIGCTFHIEPRSKEQEEDVKHLENGEMQEVNELIEEGKVEESDNR
ncbi:endonuclease/exonuclease/phosphatase family protein [Sphingobacterium sp. FBM7-1]|uniref:endonuclease/exonuclease/phosphatase family protein n=1 Tax=Sphingobacterium sp. FBM7-1 TaxID=2886688 RepID=UPI001D11D56A|nr:endonuclease/exonuclease/phosphatase family protein [Sphingobacterium sp. FBM7-1]MCC2598572.1 endonuclease/exonuclease/phosphatase family protein [Sphingobacterium sp. FBM7-1]